MISALSTLLSSRYALLVAGVALSLWLASLWLDSEREAAREREREQQRVEQLEARIRAADIREEAQDVASNSSDYGLCVYIARGMRIEKCDRLRRSDLRGADTTADPQ